MPDDPTPLEQQAERLERAAVELEQATQHCRTAASHLRGGEVPRGAAHAWAATGHVAAAERLLDDAAIDHAAHSLP